VRLAAAQEILVVQQQLIEAGARHVHQAQLGLPAIVRW
jgi:hypothetical protein